MSLLPGAMIKPEVYSHTVESVKLIETHLSWVFLTGVYAYKVKKPVCFDFVDFSSIGKRNFFCSEELRCNRAFAPELYLGVVPIVLRANGTLLVAPEAAVRGDEVIDYAVRMIQFDVNLQADLLLENKELTVGEMFEFGGKLAAQHGILPQLSSVYDPGKAILENFTTLKKLDCLQSFSTQIEMLETQAKYQLAQQGLFLQERYRDHFVRECHGDLHLSNLARLDSGLTAFDCLEFDESLRCIDVWCDIAFLFMDCCIRERADLGYAFVDGYLMASGDYSGVQLLPMFAAYRSVVRAKIAALRYEQTANPEVWQKIQKHVSWPLTQSSRPAGRLIITCGLSGSGKSYWAGQLVTAIPSLRLCADVLRKTQYGYSAFENSQSDLGQDLYSESVSLQVYERLADYSAVLLTLGENVIVDAACLKRAQREVFYKIAQQVGVLPVVLHFTAPHEVLLNRITDRQLAGNNPSEADAVVLTWQLDEFEEPGVTEPVITIDTQHATLSAVVARLS